MGIFIGLYCFAPKRFRFQTLSLESQEDMADFTISSGAFDQEEA